MLPTDTRYQRALQRLAENAETLRRQRAALAEVGLSGQELDRALAALLSFRAGLTEDDRACGRSRSSPG